MCEFAVFVLFEGSTEFVHCDDHVINSKKLHLLLAWLVKDLFLLTFAFCLCMHFPDFFVPSVPFQLSGFAPLFSIRTNVLGIQTAGISSNGFCLLFLLLTIPVSFYYWKDVVDVLGHAYLNL